jgi:glycosyltransferase involved in cell wall biosynthesis
MQETRYSVIIPVYNKERYVARAVESVLRQEGVATVENGCVELIVVDDGSLDSSYEAAKGAIGGCEGCRILRRENGGVAAARNTGIASTRGKYLCFLDADDWWEPTFLQHIDDLVTEYPQAAVFASNYYLVKNGLRKVAPIGLADSFKKGYINYCKTYSKTLCMPITSSSTVVLKQAVESVGGFNEQLTLGEDFDLWIRLAIQYKVAFVNIPLSNYFQDVPTGMRATRRLHDPKGHMLWNLDYLREIEQQSKDLKCLLDRLRCGGLYRYYLSNKYHEAAVRELMKVEWSNVPKSMYRRYHSPRWVQKCLFCVRKMGSTVKQSLLNS